MQNQEILHKVRNDPKRKAGVLLKALPITIVTDLQRKLCPKLLSDADYDDLEHTLLEKFEEKKSTVGAAVTFFKYKQQQGQTIEQFSQQLNFLASKCGFDKQCTLDRLLRDVFIAGLNSPAILATVLQSAESKTFSEAVEKAKLVQQLRDDASTMYANTSSHQNIEPLHQIKDAPEYTSEYDVHKLLQKKKVPSTYTCMRCGAKARHFVSECFAIKLECNLCGKVGHISRACKSKPREHSRASSTVPSPHTSSRHHAAHTLSARNSQTNLTPFSGTPPFHTFGNSAQSETISTQPPTSGQASFQDHHSVVRHTTHDTSTVNSDIQEREVPNDLDAFLV